MNNPSLVYKMHQYLSFPSDDRVAGAPIPLFVPSTYSSRPQFIRCMCTASYVHVVIVPPMHPAGPKHPNSHPRHPCTLVTFSLMNVSGRSPHWCRPSQVSPSVATRARPSRPGDHTAPRLSWRCGIAQCAHCTVRLTVEEGGE